jgi:hypothetical protein
MPLLQSRPDLLPVRTGNSLRGSFKKKPGRKGRASVLNGTSDLLAPKFPAGAYTVGVGVVAELAFDSKRELRHEVPARRETE